MASIASLTIKLTRTKARIFALKVQAATIKAALAVAKEVVKAKKAAAKK